MLPDREQGGASLPQPVVCGFLASCREDLTTQVQVIVRVCVLKLGQLNKKGPRIEEATGKRPDGAALAF